MTTLKEIADECNVSISTISLALNHPGKIAQETRTKIYDVMTRNGYIWNKGQATTQIGVIFSNFHNDFFGDFYSEVMYGILQKSSEINLNIRLLNNFDTSYDQVHDLHGLLFVGDTPIENYKRARAYHIPFFNCGHPHYADLSVPSLYISKKHITTQLAKFVFNCNHKHIALIMGEDDPQDILSKEFIESIREVYTELEDSNIYVVDYNDIHATEVVWTEIMSKHPAYTAIMCSSDLLAYYLYICAAKYNMSIPKDISITGFDGIKLARYMPAPSPRLTTVASNISELGRKSVELLLTHMQGAKLPERTMSLASTLLIGDSVRRLGSQRISSDLATISPTD